MKHSGAASVAAASKPDLSEDREVRRAEVTSNPR
jgi:hypothetical protein